MIIWYEGEGDGTGNAGGVVAGAGAPAAGVGAAGGAPVVGDKSGAVAFEIPADFDVRTILPEDVRAHASLEKFSKAKGKDFIEQIVRSNISAQALIGTDPNELVKLPPADKVTAEQRMDLMKRVGLPVKPEAWTLKSPEGTPKGFEADAPLGKWLQETSAKLGIFPDQMQAVYEGFVKQAGEWQTAAQTKAAGEAKTNVEGLQREYGKGFDDAIKYAGYAVKTLSGGNGDLKAKLEGAGLATDPVLFKAMEKVGRLLAEGSSGGDKPDFNGGQTPSAIKAEADKLLRAAVQVMDTNPREARRLNEEAQKILAKAN